MTLRYGPVTGERTTARCGLEWGLHVCNLPTDHGGEHVCGGYLERGRCGARLAAQYGYWA
jgi:hypothetical protein